MRFRESFLPKPKGSEGFHYLSARVHAWKAELFRQSDYEKMLKMEPNEIAKFISERSYKQEIEKLGTEFSGAELVEKAVNTNLEEFFSRLFRLSYEDTREQLRFYFKRFEVEDIKRLSRGLFGKEKAETILSLMSFASHKIRRKIKDAVIESRNPEEAFQHFHGTQYFNLAMKHKDNLAELENALDKAYFEELIALDAGRFSEWCEIEGDLCNALTVIKERLSGREHSRELEIKCSRRKLKGIALKSQEPEKARQEILQKFAGTAWQELGFFQDSASPFIAFMRLKEFEAKNTKTIALGKKSGLGEERIRKELVIA